MSLLRRMPLRWRVTAVFTLAAAIVLTVLGLFLHARLQNQLDASIQSALEQRLRDVSSLVRTSPNASLEDLGGAGRAASDVTQLLTSDGEVVASEGASDQPLLEAADLTAITSGSSEVVVRQAHERHERLALLGGAVGNRIVIVGSDLRQRDEAVSELDRLLLIGLPTALLLAALAGAWASRLALAPVDEIRRRAEELGVGNLGERLPEPVADDELRRMARTLNTMLDRLQRGYQREREFVDDAAHELRTPLTTLNGELELATSRARSQDELEATVRSARRQSERLVALANDLLILARGAHGQLPLRPEPLEVRELLEGAVSRASRLPRGDAVVTGEMPAGVGTIVGDRLRLEQALDNLVSNALQHGAGRVTLGAVADGESARFTVDDEGVPIEPDLARRAFDRFARGDSARAGTGTGLGLSIVKAIAEAHGGTAGLEPGRSAGNRAWLRLPTDRRW